MLNKVRWVVTNFNVTIEEDRVDALYDRYGVAYYVRRPVDRSATFEFSGRIDWAGNAWSKAKADGLIPYLNQKLQEYEDGWTI